MKVKIAEENKYDNNKIVYRNYRLVNQCVRNEETCNWCTKPSYLWLYEEENSLLVPVKPCFSVSEALRNLMEELMFDTRPGYKRLEIQYEDDLKRQR